MGKPYPVSHTLLCYLKVKDLRSCVRQEIRMLRRSARIYIECIFAFNSVRSRINLDLLGQQLFSYCLFYCKCLLFPFNIMIRSKCWTFYPVNQEIKSLQIFIKYVTFFNCRDVTSGLWRYWVNLALLPLCAGSSVQKLNVFIIWEPVSVWSKSLQFSLTEWKPQAW